MSQNEKIIAGVGPGGLRETHDVKILVCYMLSCISAPLPREKIAEIIVPSVTDYFTFSAAFEELMAMGHLTEDAKGFSLTALGTATARNLQSSLPLTLRDKVSAEANLALQLMNREGALQTEIVPHKDGYHVRCVMADGDLVFLDLSFYAPDLASAERIRLRFREQSTGVYTALMQMLT
ncbi:MAG: DUF4364 family protein [Oscillospiraceae bacterium]|nr:DUF4364 family protein [Oscillospiraceae bacterium]